MIQVTYRRHKRGEPLETGCENIAYFPTWKAAMILVARWSDCFWAYEITLVQRVAEDHSKLHPDCASYANLVN